MLERIGHSAEQCATKLARRAFFVKGGRWALAMAGALGVVLATRRKAYGAPAHCCLRQDGSHCWASRNCPPGTKAVPRRECSGSDHMC
jgi:nicotinamide mononucleotide (NMN) deamidase PncC